MVSSFAIVCLLGAPNYVEPKIVSATAFRDGMAFVIKEIEVPLGGEVWIKNPDRPYDGTLWFLPTGDVHILDVTLTYLDVDAEPMNAETLDDLLVLNVGSNVDLSVMEPGSARLKSMNGKLKAVSAETVTLEVGASIKMVPKSWVQSISVDSKTSKTTFKVKTRTPVVRLRTKDGKAGKLYSAGLMNGISWKPSYYLDISDDMLLRFTMKATVINELMSFTGVEVGLAAGFPYLERVSGEDMLTSGTSESTRVVRPARLSFLPPYAFGSPPMILDKAASLKPGEGLVPKGITSIMWDPSDNSLIVQGTDEAIRRLDTILGEKFNDVFIYPLSDITLKRNDRMYRVLQEFDTQYQTVYVADTGEKIDKIEVARFLSLKNTSDGPWVNASAMLMNSGKLVGQATMPYTVPGGTAEMMVGKAPAVSAVAESKEVSRVRDARKTDYAHFDQFSILDSVEVKNFETTEVKIRVTRKVLGQVNACTHEGAWNQAPPTGNEQNSYATVQWEIVLKPGESKELTVDYKRFVRVG